VSVEDALTEQLARAERLKELGWDPNKIPWNDHPAVIGGGLKPPVSARLSANGGDPAKRRLVATRASQIQRKRVEWLEPGRVPIGLVTVVAGVGGLGKSQWTCLLAARLSRGDLGEPGATLIATAEDSPDTTVVPRLEACEADLDLIEFITVKTRDDDEDGISIPDDLAELEHLVRAFGVRLLVVDPLVAHLPMQIDSHRDQSVRRAIAPLYRLATTTGCAIVAILHLNKAQGLAPLARLGGSVAFGNAARSVLLLDRDPDDPDGRRVLAHIKCNVAPLAPSLLYEVTPIVLPAKGAAPMVETSRLELVGESEHDGQALLGGDEDRMALDDAKEFLSGHLADGTRHRVTDIYKAGAQLGITERTLQRARTKIGARKEKSGFTRGWEWWLPNVNEDIPLT
jgi:AAA domain